MRRKWVEHFEEPEHDDENNEVEDEQKPRTILIDYRQDPNKQKQLYLIDLEMGRIKFEDEIEKKVGIKRQSCQN